MIRFLLALLAGAILVYGFVSVASAKDEVRHENCELAPSAFDYC